MQAHFLRAREFRHFVALHELQGSGNQTVIDGVEHQQVVGLLHELHEVEPLCAAVEQTDIFRRCEQGVERLERADPKTFIGPEDVADAEDEDFLVPSQTSSSRNWRSPEIIDEIIDWRDMMSSRTAA